MKTTYYDNIEVFKYLINHGADINIISDEGMTVYDYAVKNKSEKILEYLSKIDN